MAERQLSIQGLIGKKVFVRYVDYRVYMRNGEGSKVHLLKSLTSYTIITHTIEGIFDHDGPMVHIDGGDEYGYIIIPRQFVIELYEMKEIEEVQDDC